MTIWQRYFAFETCKTSLYFLFAFYGLYVLIDYASHTGTFHHHHSHLEIKEVLIFYAAEFFRRAEVLIPLALMIGVIRTLTEMNIHHELVALMASGVSLRKLTAPFIWLGVLGVFFLYAATEWIQPIAYKQEKKIEDTHALTDSIKNLKSKVHHLQLEDGSILLFQRFDRNQKTFHDVFWIRTIDNLVRMKNLSILNEPKGYFIEFLSRKNGALELTQRSAETVFPDLKFNPAHLLETLTVPEENPLSSIAAKIKSLSPESEKEAHNLSVFLRKLILPWLSLLVVMGAVPACILHTRDLKTFKIYAFSLFGLVFTYILVNAGTTLSERQVVNPYLAILVPFGIIALLIYLRFKLKINKLTS